MYARNICHAVPGSCSQDCTVKKVPEIIDVLADDAEQE